MATKKKSGGTRAATTAAKISKTIETEPLQQPTPELMQRAAFVIGPVKSEMGKVIGRAFRRRAIFENMAEQGAISPDELAALRFYRTTFDRCDRSPMRSCLDVDGNGVPRADAVAFMRTKSVLEAKKRLRMCEAGLAGGLPTMRAVALDDQSFSQIAIARFGCRVAKFQPVDAAGRARGEHREQIRPRSGRDREVIKQEFHAALQVLTDTVRSVTTRNGVEELWIHPADDGSATIRRGVVAPVGLYRCWGDSQKLDAIITSLRHKHGGALQFNSPRHARTALNKADRGRLERLESHEMGA